MKHKFTWKDWLDSAIEMLCDPESSDVVIIPGGEMDYPHKFKLDDNGSIYVDERRGEGFVFFCSPDGVDLGLDRIQESAND